MKSLQVRTQNVGIRSPYFYHLHREDTYTQRNGWLKKKCVVNNGLRWYMPNIFCCFILIYMAENWNSLRSDNHPHFHT